MVDGLVGELRQWEAVSRVGGPLEKHRTQIDAVLVLLNAGVVDARERLADGRADSVPARILDLHHVWDFFRGRFLLRRVRGYRRTLEVADELAWECYRPVLDLPGSRPKEPPLAGFSRTASPRAHRRGSAYLDLLPRGGIHTREGRIAAARLPFPVIDIPWHYDVQLPALLTVAHEAGHHIEDDCGLGDEIRERIRAAELPPERVPHWEHWRGEAFADVCAAVVCGTAYAEVLAELLEVGGAGVAGAAGAARTTEAVERAGTTGGARTEGLLDGQHPPPAIRVRLARAAAVAAGHPRGADGPDEPHGPEITAIVSALLDTGYDGLGGRRLTHLLVPPDAEDVFVAAERLLHRRPSGCARAATALAAAALAFQRDPVGYEQGGVAERVEAEVLRLRGTGSRAPTRRGEAAVEEGRLPAYGEAGELLLQALDADGASSGAIRP
ncbi:hypothetical protein [Streptomyces endophyticus]|uniref:Uncharacterized protein n=1 Tax=Streptomyces endophyticus TaxID=714166 RepID=A0ABU6FG43_9ACTN|nr:hypothetical protein [Streptomyces endophyticus]MEB8343016.1 hypothetical protein [Streptomyces endophyticus]